ncbi:hypothetical protein [Nannocystis pusilla]|uniref:hypothetical protein n=1 Tax=Nannocystis pusilla TaxID=889268 RepID=UPI003B7A6DFF
MLRSASAPGAGGERRADAGEGGEGGAEAVAEGGEHQVDADEGGEGCAEGVGAVDPPEAAAVLVGRTGAAAGLDQRGERGAERGGAEGEDGGGDRSRGGQGRGPAGGGDRAEPGRQDAREQLQEMRRDDREAGGDQLEHDEQARRVAGPEAAVVQQRSPQREPGEEAGQGREHADCLAAERQRQHARPQHLVGEGRRARGERGDQQEAVARAGRC